MRTAMQKTMGTLFPFGNIEEVGRQNMAMMERAFSLFTPFYRGAEPANPSDEPGSEIEALRSEIERLRQELENAKKK
jgi:polyhydroxyalkanoate synthesis regulator protein